jgi:hypothetical protein
MYYRSLNDTQSVRGQVSMQNKTKEEITEAKDVVW